MTTTPTPRPTYSIDFNEARGLYAVTHLSTGLVLSFFDTRPEAQVFVAAAEGANTRPCCLEAAQAGNLAGHLKTWDDHLPTALPYDLESSYNS